MGAVNLDIPYFSLLLLVAFVLKHNVDEKNMRNIDVRIHVKLEVNCQSRFFWDPSSQKKWPRKNLDPRKKIDAGRKFWPT